ncbi:MAG: glycosyltransferase family 2 protein [Thermoanaerobaculum sp.]
MAAEVVVVDHSEDEAEVEALRAVKAERLIAQPNRGYAAGVNRGVAAARGEVLIVANPDVELREGALEPLLAALGEYAVVSPQLWLGPLRYPPTEPHRPTAELARLVVARWPRFRKPLVVREFRRAISVWSSTRPVRQLFLSGALLAFRSDTFQGLGPWDEDYFLYYEETDWLLRAHRRGFACALVPTAHAEHGWGASANPSQHGRTVLLSRRRYYRKNFPFWGYLVSSCPVPAPCFPRKTVPKSLPVPGKVWWFVSPVPVGVPAFGIEAGSEFPQREIRNALSPERHPRTWLVGAMTKQGRLEGLWRWDV